MRFKITWMLVILSLQLALSTSNANELENFYTPVMLPMNDVCIRKAIELGFRDIGNVTIHGATVNYSMTALYYELSRDISELIETTNLIHNFDIKTELRTPTISRKRITIGPPYQEQIFTYSEFADILPIIQVSYKEIPEPYEASPVFRLQVPPSVAGIIRASRKFVVAMNWTQVVLVYDFSNSRYRHSVNTLEQHLSEVQENRQIKVVYKARIQSDTADVRVDSLLRLSHLNSRILFLMVGVPGARLAFCQAYQLKLYKSNYVWILFEQLPEDWASDKHNAIDTETGQQIREIECTEDQLLSVTRDYIYIVRSGLRKDGKKAVNGIPIDQFQKHFDDFVNDPSLSCTDEVYYAYDAAWLSVQFLQHSLPFKKGPLTFEAGFRYMTGISFRKNFLDEILPTFQMEGITGPMFFRTDPLFKNRVRVGLQSIFHKRQKQTATFIGLFNENLTMEPNAVENIFGGQVPSDHARYFYTEYKFPESYVITIWVLVFLCIITVVVLTCLIGICHSSNNNNEGGKRPRELHWVDFIILLGCIVGFISLIVYGLDTRYLTRDQYKDGCYAFLFTLSLGFSFTFGGMFARTWWVYKSFTAPSVQNGKREYPEWFMLLLVSFFIMVDIVLLVSWATTSPFHYVVSNPTNQTETYGIIIEEIVKCDGKYQAQFMIGLYAYKGVVIIFGVFLTWQTANRVNKRSTRSRSEAMAIYNTALVSIVGVVCISLLEDSSHRHALYVILTICVIICCGSVVAVVFVPKISSILYPFGSDNSSQGSTDQENNKKSFTKFTLELRRRVTGKNSPKYPSVSSVATSQISISTATSSLDSRKNMIRPTADYPSNSRQGSFATEPPPSQPGSLVSYNQSFSSPVGAATILEVSGEETIQDIIADHPSIDDSDRDSSDEDERNVGKQTREEDISLKEEGVGDMSTQSPPVMFTNNCYIANEEEVA